MIAIEKIELIKNTAQDNIIDVIGKYVSLKKRGSVYVGLSPFSNERTPSFTVNPAKGIFKCFSSGNGGDVIKFLMLIHHIKFIEAVKLLAQIFNIDIAKNESIYQRNLRSAPVIIQPDYIHPDDMLCTLANYEHNNLYKFLITRFTPAQVINAFKAYHIGIDNKNYDYVIFWQVDIHTYVRSGKFIKYKIDGHRDKDSKTFWQHTKTKD
jgi:DNA primase catalytic core